MHHKEAKENMFVDRYLAGQLGAREQRRFEEHFIGCESCQEELELTERLRAGLRSVAISSRSGPPATQLPAAGVSSAPRYAMAASAVLAASLIAAGLGYHGSGETAGPAVAEVFPIHSTRSAAETYSRIRLSSPASAAVLLVDPGPSKRHDYRVVVSKLDGDGATPVAQVSGVQPSYEDLVAISVPGSMLAPGTHLIQLEGRESADAAFVPVSELRFQVEID
ncbi:MAG: zf-HC2 domain-containing protein [Gammaproteobacteria bacterium]